MKLTLTSRLISILLVALLLTDPPTPAPAQNSAPVYLIIAPGTFSNALTPFIDLKTSQGFQPDLATLSETGSTNVEIRNYIQAYSPRPMYVLLVGDTNLIPTWYVKYDTSKSPTCWIDSLEPKDLYYAILNDYPCSPVPDLILGRLPVHNETQLITWIDKYLAYNQPPLDSPWRDKLSFIASDSETFSSNAEYAHNAVITQSTAPLGYMGTFTGSSAPIVGGDRLYPKTYHAARQDLLDAINIGRLAVTYMGPASPTAWQWIKTDYFTSADVTALTGPPVPLVLALAPSSADYRVENSMVDAWLFHTTGGALTYIGTTFDPTINDYTYLERLFWQEILTDPTANTSIGEALHKAISQTHEYYDPLTEKRFWEAYHIVGDPSLKIMPYRCGRLTSPTNFYHGELGETVQIPVTLTNLDIRAGTFFLTITAPPAFAAQINLAQVDLGPGKSTDLVVTVQIPLDIPNSSGDVQITARLDTFDLILTVHVEADLKKVYLPIIHHTSPTP